jgi:hypothetical protein
MKKWHAIYAMNLLFAIGCSRGHPDAPSIIVGQRSSTVFADEPFVDMEDGTRIGVDGVPPGQSMQFKRTQYKNSNGRIVVGVDAVFEPMSDPEQP